MKMPYTLPDIIENNARSSPENTAFRYLGDSLSYAELKSKTDSLAVHLVRSGIKKGDRIGIYMPRCLETVIAIYGIMKAGAVYVPLDPLAPDARTRFLLQDCGIRHLVSVDKQVKKIKSLLAADIGLRSVIGVSGPVSLPSFSWDAIFDINTSSYVPVNLLESDLAYVMYTSGSTGAPKGIMHSHRSGLAYAKLSADLYALHSEDTVANHAPLHFDISTFGYFSAPLAGATTVIVPDAHTKMPASLSQLMEDEKITLWYSVPLALVQLLQKGVLEKRNLSALRWVLFGGENFPPKFLSQLMACWPHARFSNVYGPAEVNQCTFYHLSSPPKENDTIPIGNIWENTAGKILDTDGREVPRGDTGELAVRSATMMIGYWNNRALTEKSMHIENMAPGLEYRYYKTGDLVRENAEGKLLFLGRNDRQIKHRGYRVELDEVEAVLLRHPKIKEAAVYVATAEEGGPKEIWAAVIADKEADNVPAELKVFCKSILPPYAVPETIHLVTEFPRTTSGKIKRSEIPEILIHP